MPRKSPSSFDPDVSEAELADAEPTVTVTRKARRVDPDDEATQALTRPTPRPSSNRRVRSEDPNRPYAVELARVRVTEGGWVVPRDGSPRRRLAEDLRKLLSDLRSAHPGPLPRKGIALIGDQAPEEVDAFVERLRSALGEDPGTLAANAAGIWLRLPGDPPIAPDPHPADIPVQSGGRPHPALRGWVEPTMRAAVLAELETHRAALAAGGIAAVPAAIALSGVLGHPQVRIEAGLFSALCDRHPTSVGARIAAARFELHRGRPDRVGALLDGIRADGDELALELARLRIEAGDFAGASAMLASVAEDPDGDAFLQSLRAALVARVALEDGDELGAERALSQASHGFRGAPLATAHLQLIEASHERTAAAQAERIIERLAGAVPVFESAGDSANATWAAAKRAELLASSGRVPEARAALEALVEATDRLPRGAEVRGIYAAVLSVCREPTEAERQFHRAPDAGRVYAWYVLHLALCGRSDAALDAAERARRRHPLADAVVAVLRRDQPPTAHDEAYLLWRALEAWRASASMARVEQDAARTASLAVRMVLAAPRRGAPA